MGKSSKSVLLVSPPTSSYLGAARPPQNLGYLAESLLANNIEYRILDMRLGNSEKQLIQTIKTFEPDIVGFSVVSLEYKRTYDLISIVKKDFPHILTIAGGPHVTVLREEVLDECPAIDLGVVHEGEQTLVDVCKNRLPIPKISGLLWRDKALIRYNGPRDMDIPLDEIPFPTYKNFELDKYINEIPLNSSRGCPYQCIFCPNKMILNKFRWRSAEHVVDEIEYWYQKGYRVFNFDDDNFTFHNDRIYQICDEIDRRKIVNCEFRCSNGLRADRVNRPLLERMREVGFSYIAFGVDGGNDRMLKMNKKGETLKQIETAIADACELNFEVKIFIITCMPYETLDDVEDSFRLALKYPVQRVILNNPIPYPGTELFDIVQSNRWFLKQPEHYLNHITENENVPVFETPEISRDDRIRLLTRMRKIEKTVTRNAVRRMYQKYKVINMLMAYIFSLDIMEKMFFKTIWFRRFVEKIRYKRALRRS